MPRDIPVGNRRLLVCFDRDYVIRDLYYPRVGQENHVGGGRCRMGCWTDDRFAWIGPEWKPALAYEEGTLVTHVILEHPDLEVRLICRDAVDFHEDVYLREIVVENQGRREREIRLFLVQRETFFSLDDIFQPYSVSPYFLDKSDYLLVHPGQDFADNVYALLNWDNCFY